MDFLHILAISRPPPQALYLTLVLDAVGSSCASPRNFGFRSLVAPRTGLRPAVHFAPLAPSRSGPSCLRLLFDVVSSSGCTCSPLRKFLPHNVVTAGVNIKLKGTPVWPISCAAKNWCRAVGPQYRLRRTLPCPLPGVLRHGSIPASLGFYPAFARIISRLVQGSSRLR